LAARNRKDLFMKRTLQLIPALAAAALFAGGALAQNTGETGGGASTRTGAGVVTSGSAVPAGQQPRATDTTLGKQPGGTGAGMGNTPAGTAQADPKKAADASKDQQAGKNKPRKARAAAGGRREG